MSLVDYIYDKKMEEGYEAVVVEGYDGVGKGHVLNMISEAFQVTPYRPDYNLWNEYDVRKSDRWKISGFFWDIYSHFDIHSNDLLLFDRGVLSGAVYAHDFSIAEAYKKIIRNKKILHILVTCSEEDFILFQRSRNPDIDPEYLWKECRAFTEEYQDYMERIGVDYYVYKNEFDSHVDSDTCYGCGHYSYGICRHPLINKKVDPSSYRCEYSKDEEVQDRDDSEMYSVQS